MEKKPKDYHNIGSMKTKKEKDDEGNTQYYIEIDKKYLGRISIDGKKLTSKYINVNRPTVKLEGLLKAGVITEADFDQQSADFAPEGKLNFVKFDLKLEIEK